MRKHRIKSSINSRILTKKRLSKKRRLSKKKRFSLKRKTPKNAFSFSLQNQKRRSKKMYGGYSQYQNNVPLTPTYSTAGLQNNFMSALANPVPYNILPNCTNCVDNYNHYTNMGFPSRGSY